MPSNMHPVQEENISLLVSLTMQEQRCSHLRERTLLSENSKVVLLCVVNPRVKWKSNCIAKQFLKIKRFDLYVQFLQSPS